LGDVETDLRETKFKRWRQKGVNREERVSVVKIDKEGSQRAVEPRSE
jgi:hypothetical protein